MSLEYREDIRFEVHTAGQEKSILQDPLWYTR